MRRRVGLVLLLIAVAAGAVNYLRPIPAAVPTSLRPAATVIKGTAPNLPWPSHGSAAVGAQGIGFIASSGNEQAIPAASVTKVMTALVVLKDKPLQKGQSGPIITMTEEDVRAYQLDLQSQQSVVKVEVGEPLTELQVLEGMLIPSANNLAETIARWDAGSATTFVDKMNARAVALHLSHTRFTDTSGASPGSVSTPTDLLALGMAAMQDPVLAQVVALEQVDLPVAGVVYNVNAALAHDGIFGIKTGSGLDSGANFLFAANATVDSHTIVVYGCVMGQPTLDAAFSAAESLITAVSSALHVQRVLERNQTVAIYNTAWGEQADAVSLFDVDLVEWPGMVLRERLEAPPLAVDKPLASSTRTGVEHVTLGDYSFDVSLATANPLFPPGRFWRLTRVAV
ncbi:MAG TPA: D-alanyl-D-alanine carboxypeptidase [Candidatus Dormibacteraeota bacterium]|jgi:D-alanyl-D-alanine carboxypeptidase (penicillin-binding protein 5/6)|nr:D-alanyl-D-alanine carboxypeptidase [Candidatus Dormibacteraeota bacterium]